MKESDVVRALFDNLDVMAWAIDNDGKILISEGGALRVIGVEPGQLVGYNAFELGNLPDSTAHMRRALAGERLVALAQVAGRELESRFAPLRAANGEIVGMTSITVDVTPERHKQAELERQTIALREQAELLDLAHDAIVVRALDGTITYWNRGAHKVYGFSREAALGRNVHSLLRAEAGLHEREAQLLATDAWDGELEMTHNNGHPVIVTSRWVLKRDAAGAPEAVLQIDTDVTARKRAEAAEARRQDDLIKAQALAIEELSTPLIPITDEILVMPLIGMMDSVRAKQVMTNLLDGLAASRGKFAILDITGVPVVDTAVASAILKAAHAARLLGTEVILTGIRPEVAQTLVHIDANLQNITTRGTLQSGIAYAIKRGGQQSL